MSHPTPRRVLVVDDEVFLRRLMERQIRRLGHECDAAESAGAALRQATSSTYDVVIVDRGLGEVSGGTLTRELVRLDPDRPVVLMSGSASEELARDASESGAADVLLKPFSLAELRSLLDRNLRLARLQRRNRRLETRLDRLDASTRRMERSIERALAESFDDTVTAFVNAIEARDAETRNHSRRARAYTLLIAEHAGIGADELRHVGWGALLHDIGKIAVPDSILLKPGALTPDEWEVMRQHPLVGYEMIRGIAFLEQAAEIVLAHHERFDGSGYPYGRRGDEIPLGARCFAIADAIETITSRRAYKRPESFEVAAAEVVRCAGTHFDPELVAVFQAIPLDKFRAIRDRYLEATGEILDPRIAALLRPDRAHQPESVV